MSQAVIETHAMDRVFAALDTPDAARAARLVEALRGEVGGVKIGNELFTALGPEGVRAVAGGERLFLDLKFHDIPNTVAGAVRSAVQLRPFCMTLHASGGRAMMQAAAEAAREAAEELEVARPPEACSVRQNGRRCTAERTAPATVLGMSWNFRSRNRRSPRATARTPSGPWAVNSSLPILTPPTSPRSAVTRRAARAASGVSMAAKTRSMAWVSMTAWDMAPGITNSAGPVTTGGRAGAWLAGTPVLVAASN